MITYFIVCPLVFLAGFVDAIAGGGGLISLPAYMIAGLPTHASIATNKLSATMGTTISSIHYFKQGYMKLKICLPGVIAAIIGSFLGAHLSLLSSDFLLKVLMLIFLPLIAFYVLKDSHLADESIEPFSSKKTMVLCFMISFVVGIYDGFYGPGTGTFLMLLFTGLAHLSLFSAAGTTKAINLTTNVISLSVFLLNGQVLIPLGLTAGICNMVGNYMGSHCFSKKGATFIKPLILTVLVVFFLRLLYELIV